MAAGSIEGRLARGRAVSIQTYARIAGALILVTTVAGFFGEVYVPSRLIVSGDATATARNITTLSLLFRLGFASYLVEALCDVALVLRPLQRDPDRKDLFHVRCGQRLPIFLLWRAPRILQLLPGVGYLCFVLKSTQSSADRRVNDREGLWS